jgi:hypothetical protein
VQKLMDYDIRHLGVFMFKNFLFDPVRRQRRYAVILTEEKMLKQLEVSLCEGRRCAVFCGSRVFAETVQIFIGKRRPHIKSMLVTSRDREHLRNLQEHIVDNEIELLIYSPVIGVGYSIDFPNDVQYFQEVYAFVLPFNQLTLYNIRQCVERIRNFSRLYFSSYHQFNFSLHPTNTYALFDKTVGDVINEIQVTHYCWDVLLGTHSSINQDSLLDLTLVGNCVLKSGLTHSILLGLCLNLFYRLGYVIIEDRRDVEVDDVFKEDWCVSKAECRLKFIYDPSFNEYDTKQMQIFSFTSEDPSTKRLQMFWTDCKMEERCHLLHLLHIYADLMQRKYSFKDVITGVMVKFLHVENVTRKNVLNIPDAVLRDYDIRSHFILANFGFFHTHVYRVHTLYVVSRLCGMGPLTLFNLKDLCGDEDDFKVCDLTYDRVRWDVRSREPVEFLQEVFDRRNDEFPFEFKHARYVVKGGVIDCKRLLNALCKSWLGVSFFDRKGKFDPCGDCQLLYGLYNFFHDGLGRVCHLNNDGIHLLPFKPSTPYGIRMFTGAENIMSIVSGSRHLWVQIAQEDTEDSQKLQTSPEYMESLLRDRKLGDYEKLWRLKRACLAFISED